MYNILLSLHSIVRWLVLISLLIAIYKAYSGWSSNRSFSKSDNMMRIMAASFVHLQLLLGIWLYFVSPIVNHFLHHFSEAVSEREVRFFGMEHVFMMLVAVVVITIGSSKAKKKTTDIEKFKTMAIWFSIGLFIILVSIPWPFYPLAPHRPFFRMF